MSRDWLFQNRPLIYLITDGEATAQNFPVKSVEILKLVETAAASKIDLIQIREKNISAKLVFELASKAVRITRHTSTKIFINDRADIAQATQADGVHLTSTSLPMKIIRQNFPENFIVGVSAHSLDEAVRARDEGADFVTFSPIYKTPSKAQYGEPQGLEELRDVCRKLNPFPVIALGGIDETNFSPVLESGAAGFAAIRFLKELFKRGDAEAQRFFVELRNEQK